MLKQDNKSVFNDVIRHRAAILQEFFRAYLAENVTKSIQIKDLELVEEHNKGEIAWFFRPKTKK